MEEYIVSGIISILVAAITALVTLWIAQERHKREYKFEISVERTVLIFLSDKRFKSRKFDTIKRHIRGLKDDDLRKILLSVGAVCIENEEGDELWGLYDQINRKIGS